MIKCVLIRNSAVYKVHVVQVYHSTLTYIHVASTEICTLPISPGIMGTPVNRHTPNSFRFFNHLQERRRRMRLIDTR